MECTGAAAVIRDCLGAAAPAGIVCLTGVTEPGKTFDLDIGRLNRKMVLDNDTVFGSVNANRRHYEMAAEALARADKRWLRAIDHAPRSARELERSARTAPGRHQGRHRFCPIGRHVAPHRGLRPDRRLPDGRAGRTRRLDRLAVLAALRS